MQDESMFGKDYLQFSDHIRVRTCAAHRHCGRGRADDSGIILSAPLLPNANYKGTAFGGSLFSVAVLTGWAWVSRYLDTSGTCRPTR